MKYAAAALVAVISLTAPAAPDPPALTTDELPCTNPAARLSNGKMFNSPYKAARLAIKAEDYEQGLELARAAAASARSLEEVLLAVRLQRDAFGAIGDRAGRLWMMREEVRLGEACPNLFVRDQLADLRAMIRVEEHLLEGGSLENYRAN